MTLQGISGLALVGVGGIVGAVIILMYAIRWQLPRRVVATTLFWLSATGRSMGRRGVVPEQWLSLALQLLIAGSIMLAAAQPRLSCQSRAGRTVVLVLDRSPSMATQERVETRMELAKSRAVEQLRRTAASDAVGLVVTGPLPEVIVPVTRDHGAIRREIARQSVRMGRGNLDRAVEMACQLLEGTPEGIRSRSSPTVRSPSAPVRGQRCRRSWSVRHTRTSGSPPSMRGSPRGTRPTWRCSSRS